MKSHAPVSVIIPCYRSVATVGRAVGSVLAQTLLPEELILVDDASDDDGRTLMELERVEKECRRYVNVTVVRLPSNGGPSVARNAGWEAATQPYLSFLDADDVWHPEKIERQYAWMASHPHADMSGNRCEQFSSSVDVSPLPVEFAALRVGVEGLLFSNRFSTPCVMLKRTIPKRFEAARRYSEDFQLWLRIAAAGFEVWHLDIALAYRFKPGYGAGGLSGDLWAMEAGELKTFWRLWRDGDIGLLYATAALGVSLVKHVRRLVFHKSGKWLTTSR